MRGSGVIGKRYSLSVWEVGVLFGALGLLAALNVVQLLPEWAADAPVDVTGAEVQGREMSGDMLWHYERWDRRNTSVGVFARGETAFGWVDRYLDVETARTDALAWCGRHGTDCEVIEVRDTLEKVDGVGIALTRRLVPIMARVRATPGSVALAVAGTGAYGIGRGDSASLAGANAMAVCTVAAAKDRPAFLPTHPCKVIYQR